MFGCMVLLQRNGSLLYAFYAQPACQMKISLRSGGASAITELYALRVANPRFLPLLEGDIEANATGGTLEIRVASAKADVENPTLPDQTTEGLHFEVAKVTVVAGGGSAVDITGDMEDLNVSGVPARDAFMRVVVVFTYDIASTAAFGPFMKIDELTATFTSN